MTLSKSNLTAFPHFEVEFTISASKFIFSDGTDRVVSLSAGTYCMNTLLEAITIGMNASGTALEFACYADTQVGKIKIEEKNHSAFSIKAISGGDDASDTLAILGFYIGTTAAVNGIATGDYNPRYCWFPHVFHVEHKEVEKHLINVSRNFAGELNQIAFPSSDRSLSLMFSPLDPKLCFVNREPDNQYQALESFRDDCKSGNNVRFIVPWEYVINEEFEITGILTSDSIKIGDTNARTDYRNGLATIGTSQTKSKGNRRVVEDSGWSTSNDGFLTFTNNNNLYVVTDNLRFLNVYIGLFAESFYNGDILKKLSGNVEWWEATLDFLISE